MVVVLYYMILTFVYFVLLDTVMMIFIPVYVYLCIYVCECVHAHGCVSMYVYVHMVIHIMSMHK